MGRGEMPGCRHEAQVGLATALWRYLALTFSRQPFLSSRLLGGKTFQTLLIPSRELSDPNTVDRSCSSLNRLGHQQRAHPIRHASAVRLTSSCVAGDPEKELVIHSTQTHSVRDMSAKHNSMAPWRQRAIHEHRRCRACPGWRDPKTGPSRARPALTRL